jgi:TPR repeat protein
VKRFRHSTLESVFLPVSVLTLILISPTVNADYQSGLDAYNQGRYHIAMDDWKAFVETPAAVVSPAIYAEAHYAIGMLYWLGQGVEVDYLEASRWLRKAAELGHSGAQGKLGYLYTAGIAVQQNYTIAFQWFSKAAQQGDVDGQYNLGIFYLNGWGTDQNKTMAAQYLAAASAQGDESAEVALQELLPQLTQDIFFPAAWILQQDPSHYTIQVIGLRTESALDQLVVGHEDIKPWATFELQRNNKPLHMLIQGAYPDVEAARAAKASFPASIQNNQELWIRTFGKVQEVIRAEQQR